jgi:RecJ-like exonuclease
MEEMYCIECHGRGLDSNDKPCPRCGGTGYEPEFEPVADVYGPAAGPYEQSSFAYPPVRGGE